MKKLIYFLLVLLVLCFVAMFCLTRKTSTVVSSVDKVPEYITTVNQ